jgi:hypothetical protein
MQFGPNIKRSNHILFPENSPFRIIDISLSKKIESEEPGKDCYFITLSNRIKARFFPQKITFPGTTKKPKISHKKIINVLGPLSSTNSARIEVKFASIHHYLLEFNSCGSELRSEFSQFQKTVSEQTAAWKVCNLSNFEYLLLLNTMMGRSFRDQSAYPIMPWVISDFDCETFNLNDPTFFRSFEIPRETSSDCLYYLSRIEPFRSLQSLNNQFISMKNAFSSTRELIPEFFISPEFLLDDSNPVVLPKWANSPIDFIYKHRIALETDYISSHLHLWITSLGYDCSQRNLSSVREGQFVVWRIAVPQGIRAVLFPSKMIWMINQFDGLLSGDLKLKNPQFIPIDIPKRRISSEPIRFCISSFPVFCCVYQTSPCQVTLYTPNREPSIFISTQKIVKIHCDFPILVWMDSDFVLSVVDLPHGRSRYSIQLISVHLNVLYVSFGFHVIICGFRNGFLEIFSLKNRSHLRSIDLEIGKPLKVLVTPAWGFIVVCVKEIVEEGSQFWLCVYTINGMFVRKCSLKSKIVEWIAWKNRSGFDYLAYCDKGNHLFVVEVYYGDVIRAVYDLEYFVYGLHFSNEKEMIVAACDAGKHEILRATAVYAKERMNIVE